jgi:hypothetical protein
MFQQNIALATNTTASSIKSTGYSPNNAVDGKSPPDGGVQFRIRNGYR